MVSIDGIAREPADDHTWGHPQPPHEVLVAQKNLQDEGAAKDEQAGGNIGIIRLEQDPHLPFF